MSSESYTFRLVVLGGGKVGKTSIISRMLNNTFPQYYVETVEDLHNRRVKIDGKNYQVNILDTAGVLQFPAMRRLSICNAQGFLLVYEVTETSTLQQLKSIIEEIKDERGADMVNSIPTVLVGNKIDQEIWHEIIKDDVEAYLRRNDLDWPVVEVSAKRNLNIDEIGSTLCAQWRLEHGAASSAYSPSNMLACCSSSTSAVGISVSMNNVLHEEDEEENVEDLKLYRTVSMRTATEMGGAAGESSSSGGGGVCSSSSNGAVGGGPPVSPRQQSKPQRKKESAVRSISLYGRRLSTSFHRHPKKNQLAQGDSDEAKSASGSTGSVNSEETCKIM